MNKSFFNSDLQSISVRLFTSKLQQMTWVKNTTVDEKGLVVILKNNSPRYLLVEFSNAEHPIPRPKNGQKESQRSQDWNRFS